MIVELSGEQFVNLDLIVKAGRDGATGDLWITFVVGQGKFSGNDASLIIDAMRSRVAPQQHAPAFPPIAPNYNP